MAKILKNTDVKLGTGTLDKSAVDDFKNTQSFTALSPVTGSFKAIRIGDIVFLKGLVTPTKGGDRIANMGERFAPKETNVYLPVINGHVMVNTNGVLLCYTNDKSVHLDSVSYYVGE